MLTGRFATNRHVRRAVLTLGAALALGGCYQAEPWNNLDAVEVDHALTSFSDCGAFEEYAKLAASQLMRAQVEAAHDSDVENVGWGTDVAMEDGASGDGDADGDADYSQTNVQEAGVDEADLLKTDGDYLYALHSGELVIVDAADDGTLEIAGRVAIGGYADELFVYGDTAVVFSNLTEDQVPAELRLTAPTDSWGYPECWDGWCYGAQSYAQIALVDISDRAAPELIRTVAYAGRYVTSRRIDDSVRVVLHSPLPALEMSWDYGYYDEEDWWGSESSINKFYKRLISENEERFAALTLDEILPKKLDSADGVPTPIADCDDILGPATPTGIGLTTVVSFDLEHPNDAGSTLSVFGAEGIVYASLESLYLTTSRQYVIAAWDSGLWEDESSGIHKFDIARDDAAAHYLGTGAVAGRLLDQFCLGEHEGYLRVATTTGSAWNPDELENHVFVLEQQGGALPIVGQLDGLGLGEEIYAARFMGDRGFMVTFYEMDPLYTLDLSDPTAPVAVGEWHGPGYSTYLHPVGEDQLLSVGMVDWRIAISLYDLSDFGDPTLLTRLFFPNDSYSTAAVYEHKAFTFDPETGLLALPFQNWEDYDTGIYTFTLADDWLSQGPTLHLDEGSEYYEGQARRSAWIGDYLYGVSRCRITSGLIDDPAEAIDTVELFTIGSCDDYGEEWGNEWW